LAVLATAGTAFAQSTVTLSGTFSAGYQSFESAAVTAVPFATDVTTGVMTGKVAAAAKTNKGLNTASDSAIKATIVEDLGGGLKLTVAGQFSLGGTRAGPVNKDDTSLTLAGGFGSLAIANTRTSDTAGNALVFASSLPLGFYNAIVNPVRANADVLSYTSPEVMPGLKFGIARAEWTQGDTTSAITQNILSATYAAGPLMLAVAQKSFSGAIATTTEKSNTELAATYDFGVVKVGLGHSSAIDTTTAYTGKKLTSYGISVPVGALTFGFNGAKRGDNNYYDAGINYSLSKRTTARAHFGKIEGGSNAGNQYRVGLVHTF